MMQRQLVFVWLMKGFICDWKETTMLWMGTGENEVGLVMMKGKKRWVFDKARKHGAKMSSFVLVCLIVWANIIFFHFWGLWCNSWLMVHLLGIWNSTCALLWNTSPPPIINAIIFYTLPFAIIFQKDITQHASCAMFSFQPLLLDNNLFKLHTSILFYHQQNSSMPSLTLSPIPLSFMCGCNNFTMWRQ